MSLSSREIGDGNLPINVEIGSGSVKGIERLDRLHFAGMLKEFRKLPPQMQEGIINIVNSLRNGANIDPKETLAVAQRLVIITSALKEFIGSPSSLIVDEATGTKPQSGNNRETPTILDDRIDYSVLDDLNSAFTAIHSDLEDTLEFRRLTKEERERLSFPRSIQTHVPKPRRPKGGESVRGLGA